MVRELYAIGLLVSIFGLALWPIIILSQLKQLKGPLNRRIKYSLLAFGIVAFLSNIAPAWYDIVRILHPSLPGPITYLKIASDITFRATATVSFFLIYNYDIKRK